MKKMILTVAVAGLSVLAVAQSEKKKEVKPSDPVVSPRDSATGMATGKKTGYDVKEAKGAIQEESQSSTAREAQTGQASGKVQNVSADAATKTADHSVTAPRDAATGQASGKRQHTPVTLTTTEDKAAQPKPEPKK